MSLIVLQGMGNCPFGLLLAPLGSPISCAAEISRTANIAGVPWRRSTDGADMVELLDAGASYFSADDRTACPHVSGTNGKAVIGWTS
jgi:hypothetical protein